MPAVPNDIDQVRVEVLGRSVDESTTWTTTGSQAGRNALADFIDERVVTRLLNAFYTDILGATQTANGVATRFVEVVGDVLGPDKPEFDALGTNLIQAVAAGGAGGRFEHPEPAAVATWTVPHNFHQRLVSVQVVNDSGDTIWGDWDYADDDFCVLKFSQPVAGTAIIRR